MITKIFPQTLTASQSLIPSLTQRREEQPEFHTLLKEKLEPGLPLEAIAAQVLSRVVEISLSSIKSEEGLNFFPSSLSLASPPQPPGKGELPVLPLPNLLQEQQGFDPLVKKAAENYGVDPSLIKAVIEVESSGNPMATSPSGAQGLMQLMPGTASDLGVDNPFDPNQNIMAGARYLRQLLDRYRGDTRLALAAYNWGMGNLEKRPESLPRETKEYITKVENHYHRYRNSSSLG